MAESAQYTMRHFTQNNPRGPEQGDVPALLRRVAASIEELGPVDVYDLIMHSEVTDDGLDWPSITVYYDLRDDDDDDGEDQDDDAPGPADDDAPEPKDEDDGHVIPLPNNVSALLTKSIRST